MNKVILVGNLTRDPEISTVGAGISMTKFSVAVQRKRANAEGQYEADFINCVAWRNPAEFIAKYFKKGNKIGIVGTLQTRSYDANDGTKRYVTEVIAEDVEFVSSKQGGNTESDDDEAREEKTEKKQVKLEPIDDDLPF